MENRLKKFQKILQQNSLDGFIVTSPVNIFYLTGFKGLSPTEREAILIFNPKAHLVTARLYQSEANKLKSPDLEIKIATERNEIFKFFEGLLSKNKRVGFEETSLTFLEHKQISTLLYSSNDSEKSTENSSRTSSSNNKTRKHTQLIPLRDLVETQRMIKSVDEIAKIEKAQIISQKAFAQVIKTLKVGQTEEEISQKLNAIMKSLGGQGLAFESIIASGPNAGIPHYFTGRRKIGKNEVLLFDFGAKYQDYCADLSRTIFVGKAKDEQKNIFYHVLAAQKAAISKISHGVKAFDAHELALTLFRDNNLHDYFIHGLGHGIGLEVHEKPSLRPKPSLPSKIKQPPEEILLENMVFSVEPGLYFPWGGVRIEDLVTIKNGKAKVLGNLMEDIRKVLLS